MQREKRKGLLCVLKMAQKVETAAASVFPLPRTSKPDCLAKILRRVAACVRMCILYTHTHTDVLVHLTNTTQFACTYVRMYMHHARCCDTN